jgi:hypothetical protein
MRAVVERLFPRSDPDALAIAFWARVHGLAFLHLDGKLDGGSTAAMKDRVGAAIHAALVGLCLFSPEAGFPAAADMTRGSLVLASASGQSTTSLTSWQPVLASALRERLEQRTSRQPKRPGRLRRPGV